MIVLLLAVTSGCAGSASGNAATLAATTTAGAPSGAGPSTAPLAAPTADVLSAATPALPRTQLKHTGNGAWTSRPFAAEGDSVDMAYAYDCTNFGQAGVFSAMLYGQDGLVALLANEEGTTSPGKTTTAYLNGAAGPFHIEISSECAWSVAIIGTP